jgi:hypothetical protein
MVPEKNKKKDNPDLDWRDYVAIVIASFQTTLLPVLVIIVAMFLLLLILRLWSVR